MPKLSQQTIEQIAAANDIVDVIGSYFPLKRAGTLFKALCPFHQERTPSFSVNPQRQIFKCFGCGAGGGVFKFVEMYEHLSFPDAARKLAERGGVRIVEEEFSAEEDRKFTMRKRLLALHAEAANWFHQRLMRGADAAGAREYFKKRGITSEVAKAWKLGFAPDEWDAFGSWARGEGFSREELLASGLVKLRDEEKKSGDAYDRFRGRVMFPICNDYGEVVAFSGRVLQSDSQAAKYINSPETILFTKGNILFGLHKSKRALIDAGSAIVCEGQLDLITAFEAGIENVIAPQGTAFTDKQARVLKLFVSEVVLCFDSDAAGQKAAERSLASLLEVDLVVRIAELPAGHDPDSLIRSEGAEAFRRVTAKAPDFFDYQIDQQARDPEFANPRGKAQFGRRMAEFAGLIQDTILRDAVINKVAARLGMPAGDFRQTMRAGRKPARETSSEVISPSLPPLEPGIARLCQLSLHSATARAWLLAQPWQAVLDEHPAATLLSRTLSHPLQAGDTASISAFLSTLSTEEQAQLAEVLSRPPPAEPDRVTSICWTGLRRDILVRKKDSLQARLREPGATMERIFELQNQVAVLQKQILDLQNGLTHIARPSSSDL